MEITFYNRNGQPHCYCQDDEHLYNFGGQPIAYFLGESVYSFSGRHLGWFFTGLIYDSNGHPFFLNMLLAVLAHPDVQDGQVKQAGLVVREKARAQVALAVPA